MKKIAFLLGAGSSIPAGYSSTDDLTNLITNSNEYWIDTAYNIVHDEFCASHRHELTFLVRRIICWLNDRNQEYFDRRPEQTGKAVNYEDIYYLASQLSDDATELQNPGLLPLIDQLKWEMTLWPEFKSYCKYIRRGSTMLNPVEFHQLLSFTCLYIGGIVVDILNQIGKCHKHLELITAIHEAPELNLKGIVTLAHDTHVEAFLHKQNIPYADGFSPNSTGCNWRIWKNHFQENDHIPFLKLHGSVDWHKLNGIPFQPDSPRPFTIGIRQENSVRTNSGSNAVGEPVHWERADDHQPLLLIGTFNKPVQYTWDMMLDVHYRFRTILKDLDKLVVCGYSFGDKAINTQLVLWYSSGGSLVIVDPRCPSDIQRTARFATRKFLQDEQKTRYINKKMEAIRKDELINLVSSVN